MICLTCHEPIRVNLHAGLGEPRYVHVTPAGHLALRGPDTQPTDSYLTGCPRCDLSDTSADHDGQGDCPKDSGS